MGTLEKIVQSELAGHALIVGTGTETSTSQPFILFASGIGDAWLLDPIGLRAVCLVWRSERQSPIVRETPDCLEIQWEGSYELQGELFSIDLDHPLIERRAISGYPALETDEEAIRLALQPEVSDTFGRQDPYSSRNNAGSTMVNGATRDSPALACGAFFFWLGAISIRSSPASCRFVERKMRFDLRIDPLRDGLRRCKPSAATGEAKHRNGKSSVTARLAQCVL